MERPTARPKAPSLTTVQALTIASQFGVTLAVAVALGLFAGQWLDSRLGTAIVFTLIGVFLGLGTAVTSTVGIYRAFLRRSAASRGGGRTTESATVSLANDDHTQHETRGRGPA